MKNYDALQSQEALAVPRAHQRLETRPDAREALAACPYSGETVAACRHYRPVSEHGDFPKAAECRDTFTVPLSEGIRQRMCRRGLREAGASGLLTEAMQPLTPRLQEANIGLLETRQGSVAATLDWMKRLADMHDETPVMYTPDHGSSPPVGAEST
ncbi:MAG: hypothetical protein ACHQ4F_06870 [Candidatus Dormibacteria bacterium]